MVCSTDGQQSAQPRTVPSGYNLRMLAYLSYVILVFDPDLAVWYFLHHSQGCKPGRNCNACSFELRGCYASACFGSCTVQGEGTRSLASVRAVR